MLSAILLGGITHAVAQDNAYLLALWVNGQDKRHVARVVWQDGAFVLAAESLQRAGIVVPDQALIKLDAQSGISAELDEAGQRLLLSCAAERLQPHHYDLRRRERMDVSPALRGASFGYDLSAVTGDVSAPVQNGHAGAALRAAFFDGNARLSMAGYGRVISKQKPQGARLDTVLEINQPQHMRKFVLGDAISGGLGWSRSLRFAGVQIATDFSQQPDLVTFPLPDFFGVAAVPSTVDVFIGASRAGQIEVDQGPFTLSNLPILTGGGGARIVLRDILGRETSHSLSLYSDSMLLARGLSNYSFEAGFLRQNYGTRSLDYAGIFASGTWQYGFDGFTGRMHAELAPNLMMLGGGVGRHLAGFGVAYLDVAYSQAEGQSGVLGSARVNIQAGDFSVFTAMEASHGNFQDIARMNDADRDGPGRDLMRFARLRWQLGGSVSLGSYGAVSSSWIYEDRAARKAQSLLNASYNLSFGKGIYFGITGFHNLRERTTSIAMFLSMPVGDVLQSVSAMGGTGKTNLQAMTQKSADPDGGWGYRFVAQNRRFNQLEAGANWVGERAEGDGAFALSDGRLAARAAMRGGLVIVGDDIFSTRTPAGSLALVQTGEPHVRVYRENRQVAVSDSKGQALLTDLLPYAANRIAVDVRDYPIDKVMANGERIVVPPRGAAIQVDLIPEAQTGFVALIRREDGTVPVFGALLRIAGREDDFIVGRDGEVFLTNITGPVEAQIDDGIARCQVLITPPEQYRKVPRMGPFQCRKGALHDI